MWNVQNNILYVHLPDELDVPSKYSFVGKFGMRAAGQEKIQHPHDGSSALARRTNMSSSLNCDLLSHIFIRDILQMNGPSPGRSELQISKPFQNCLY